jgi:hypothetical protein
MTGIVGLTISCMKGRGIYTKFRVKYNKKEALRSITPHGRGNFNPRGGFQGRGRGGGMGQGRG